MNHFSPREFDINTLVTLVGENYILHYCVWSPKSC
jgi:hypothetical protein